MAKPEGINNIDIKALTSSSKELTSKDYDWKGKIDTIEKIAKQLETLSNQHDDCLDKDIKSFAKLSDKVGSLQSGDNKVKSGVITAITAFTAAELVMVNNPGLRVAKTAEKELSNEDTSEMVGEKYWKVINNGTPGDWCACFASYCMKKNNVPESVVKRSPKVKEIYEDSQAKGTFYPVNSNYKPKAGDLIVWRNQRSHIGIVEKNTKGVVTTIEGNTEDIDYTKSVITRYNYTSNDNYDNCTGFISPNYKAKKK